MKKLSLRQKPIVKKIALLALCLLFVSSLLWFISSTKQQYNRGALWSRYHHSGDHILTQMDVRMIQPWMTFNYLTVVFKLPPGYLQTQLSIVDPHYPNIRIDYYARHHNLNQQTFLDTIRQHITNYSATSPN